METNDLLTDWEAKLARASAAHHDTAQVLLRYHFLVGIPIIIASTASTGLALYDWKGDLVSGGIALLGIAGAALASVQTFLNYGSRAAQHLAAATRISSLRRHVDLMRTPTFGTVTKDDLLALEKEWRDVAASSPQPKDKFFL